MPDSNQLVHIGMGSNPTTDFGFFLVRKLSNYFMEKYRKKEHLKKAKNNKIANVAGSV